MRVIGRPRYSAMRAKVGFGGECGNSRAARADGTHAWVWNRRFEQLACMERDWAAHTTPAETADAAKWVHQPKDCATKARNRRGINIPAGPCGRPTAESGKRRRGALLMIKIVTPRTQVQTGFFFWEHPDSHPLKVLRKRALKCWFGLPSRASFVFVSYMHEAVSKHGYKCDAAHTGITATARLRAVGLASGVRGRGLRMDLGIY